jgi:hypothetical protein
VLAVDTNIVVRFLSVDDPEQFAKANALIRGEEVYVCTTEWVLRRGYRFSTRAVMDGDQFSTSTASRQQGIDWGDGVSNLSRRDYPRRDA